MTRCPRCHSKLQAAGNCPWGGCPGPPDPQDLAVKVGFINDGEHEIMREKLSENEAKTTEGYREHVGQGAPQNYILAHMWLNLAAAQGNETASKDRDIFEERMTPADVSKAQRMARDWLAKHGKAE